MVGNLFGLLNDGTWTLDGDATEIDGTRVLGLSSPDDGSLIVILPPPDGVAARAVLAGSDCTAAVDLDTGVIADSPATPITVPTVLRIT